MNPRVQRACAWCGPVMLLFWVVGFWVLAGFMPPPGPNTTAQQWVTLLRDNTTAVRFGMILCVAGSVPLVALFAVISVHLKRIEGRDSPLAYTQMLLGLCTMIEFLFPPMILQTAAFRLDRNSDIVLSLVDLTWIPFWGITETFIAQLLIIGIVVLLDRRPEPWLPRWYGYLCLWATVMFVPGSFLVFFKSGPLAWNGFFTVWLPFMTFALVWMPATIWVITKASRKTLQPEADLESGGYGEQPKGASQSGDVPLRA